MVIISITLNLWFLVKTPEVNKRGRPKKSCQKSLSIVLEKLKEDVCERVRKISDNTDVRSDSRRIQLVRIAKKIPLLILNLVELKSKFKTSTEKYFMEAYLNAFLMFLEIIPKESQEVYFERFLKKYGSIDWVINKGKISKPNRYINSYDKFPDEFYLFWKTSFPKKKLETMNSFISQSSENTQNSDESNENDSVVLRSKITKSAMVQMISSNLIFRDCLNIVYSFCKGSDCLSKDCESVIKELLTLTESPNSIVQID